ncbi:MAG: protein kinase [Corynebacteriales bacterium]|nr:protein kinase [Mycobacteriales bacterium]
MTQTPQPDSPVPGLSELTVIARGGYATVYRAKQDSVGREVALKVDIRTLQDARDRRRFLREAEAAGRMSGHPHIVHLYDAGVTSDDHPYLVMELCSGGSYATKMRKDGPISATEARSLGIKIADALQAAHESGVLHRDVKPGNILINRYGVPGLADFGLAAVIDASHDLSVTVESLTPAYAPPEVFRLERPAEAGDIYSLCATLYAMLSGKPPRWPATGESPSPMQMVGLFGQPIADILGVPDGLMNVLRKGMAQEKQDRFASAGDLRDAFEALNADGSGTVVAPPPPAQSEIPTPQINPIAPPPLESTVSAPPFQSGTPAHSGGQFIPGPVANQASPLSPAPLAPPANFAPPMAFSPSASKQPRRGTPVLVGALVTLILLLVGVIGGGAWWLATRDDGSTSVSTDARPPQDCPFTPAGVQCPTEPECFDDALAEADCAQEHAFETFAVAALPGTVASVDAIEDNAYVKALCSTEALSTALGGASTNGWTVRVIAPSADGFAAGKRDIRCVAGREKPFENTLFGS